MKKTADNGKPSSPPLWPSVLFLLAGLGLQLSYALKFTGSPLFLLAGSVLSFAALLLALRYNRQRRIK